MPRSFGVQMKINPTLITQAEQRLSTLTLDNCTPGCEGCELCGNFYQINKALSAAKDFPRWEGCDGMSEDDYSNNDFKFDLTFWICAVIVIGGALLFGAHCSGIV